MWLNSQESVKQLIKDADGVLVGNIPFIDRNPNLLSAVSILHWMLTGKKEKKYGIFPLPGISERDILEASLFGNIIQKSLDDATSWTKTVESKLKSKFNELSEAMKDEA